MTIPGVKTEGFLVFNGVAQQAQTVEDGVDDAASTVAAAGEELQQRVTQPSGVQTPSEIFIQAPERVRRRLVHLSTNIIIIFYSTSLAFQFIPIIPIQGVIYT